MPSVRGFAFCGLCAVLVAGCAARNQLVLEQAFAPPAQQRLQLSGTTAFCDDASGRREILLAFPLPGSTDGPRDFLLFLDLPIESGETVIAPERSDAARGFLIQKVGRFAGKAVLIDGVVTCRRDLLRGPRWRLTLDANCDDETRIRGAAWIEPAPHELAAFRRRHTGDLDELAAHVRAAPDAPNPTPSPEAADSMRATATDAPPPAGTRTDEVAAGATGAPHTTTATDESAPAGAANP